MALLGVMVWYSTGIYAFAVILPAFGTQVKERCWLDGITVLVLRPAS